MTKCFFLVLVLFISSFCVACGSDGDAETQEIVESGDEPISFVQACNLHCEYAHDEPEGCPTDLSESLNACLQSCAQENAMELSSSCHNSGASYYQCTWNLTFACPAQQNEPIPSNLADCADESGEWNACLLGG